MRSSTTRNRRGSGEAPGNGAERRPAIAGVLRPRQAQNNRAWLRRRPAGRSHDEPQITKQHDTAKARTRQIITRASTARSSIGPSTFRRRNAVCTGPLHGPDGVVLGPSDRPRDRRSRLERLENGRLHAVGRLCGERKRLGLAERDSVEARQRRPTHPDLKLEPAWLPW